MDVPNNQHAAWEDSLFDAEGNPRERISGFESRCKYCQGPASPAGLLHSSWCRLKEGNGNKSLSECLRPRDRDKWPLGELIEADAFADEVAALEARLSKMEKRIRRLEGAIVTARHKLDYREIDSADEVLQDILYEMP